MYKVIVERPRSGKGDYVAAARRRDDFDSPRQLGMRVGYGRPRLNENLRPLERFLLAQVERPWNKVHGEISAGIDRRNAVQQHIFAHLDDMIATQVEWHNGRWLDLKHPYRSHFDRGDLRQPLYVDPRTGLIRANKQYRSWKTQRLEQAAREAADTAARRRVVDDTTLLLLLDGEWFEARLAPLPSDAVYDVVLRCLVQRHQYDHDERQRYFYGEFGRGRRTRQVYAVSKRQLSRREIESHGLSRKGSS
jgi:hypothetical protein